MQNRVSAQRFRQKRKNEFEILKESMDKLEAENKTLKTKVSQRNQKFKKQGDKGRSDEFLKLN